MSHERPFNEADTRAKLIDPAIHRRGWTEDLIRREETASAVEIIGGKARRRTCGKVDDVLRIKVNAQSQPVAVALLEAKKEDLPPTHGLEQAKCYAASKCLHVRFVLAFNGHQFVEFDALTARTTGPRPMSEFPSPDELRTRYEQGVGFPAHRFRRPPPLAAVPRRRRHATLLPGRRHPRGHGKDRSLRRHRLTPPGAALDGHWLQQNLHRR